MSQIKLAVVGGESYTCTRLIACGGSSVHRFFHPQLDPVGCCSCRQDGAPQLHVLRVVRCHIESSVLNVRDRLSIQQVQLLASSAVDVLWGSTWAPIRFDLPTLACRVVLPPPPINTVLLLMLMTGSPPPARSHRHAPAQTVPKGSPHLKTACQPQLLQPKKS